MRIALVVLGLLSFTSHALAEAALTVTIGRLDCVWVNDFIVYSMKSAGRYEVGKIRCDARVTAKGAGAQTPLTLELRQESKAVAKTSAETYVSATKGATYELELEAPADYNTCSDFEMVMKVGKTARSFPVKAACPD